MTQPKNRPPEPRLWPVAEAIAAMHADRTQQRDLESLAHVNLRYAEANGGLTTTQADAIAAMLGRHPVEIFSEWGHDHVDEIGEQLVLELSVA